MERDWNTLFSAWQARMNERKILPHHGYRRDSVAYELVCYVNNLFGAFHGRQWDAMAIFADRARTFVDKHPNDEDNGVYFQAVSDLVDDVYQFIHATQIEGRWNPDETRKKAEPGATDNTDDAQRN